MVHSEELMGAKQTRYTFLFVILIPTIMLIIGFFIYPYPPSELAQRLILIPLFLGLILLGIGFFQRNKILGAKWKIIGWSIFAFFWATSPAFLYCSEGGDIFNATVSIIGVYILVYLSYHEWLSIKLNIYPTCLNWIAGAALIAGIIYFTIDSGILPILKERFIHVVAQHSNAVLHLFGINSILNNSVIILNDHPITIIFACTAIQSMVLFVGMIGALPNIAVKRKIIGIMITVIPIYLLNLIRNAGVIYLIGNDITSFHIAHNVIAKIGSLIVLIVLLFIIFRLLPELYDEIMCLIGLSKRKGPVETYLGHFMEKKEK